MGIAVRGCPFPPLLHTRLLYLIDGIQEKME